MPEKNGRDEISLNGKCPTTDASCYVSFFGISTLTPNYTVIDTDYENYSIVYSCNWFLKKEVVHVLSRDPTPGHVTMESYREKVETLLPKFNFKKFAPRSIQGEVCEYPELIESLVQ
eukprot:CAMPEP_0176389464 /NCGR_PEP_ID=MMETSP0126-20121128/38400_1 /TAXON_ID=141414 ORGANISM="Strombidinopsis acuminatum, Strain SPMC142" /NCGR_SAMPLE_ID=MMETSP0126 /ASSEMBLY_ACC=CAM_ASM_000229 /LENGTH=116 /DNA_ID=CAMNT_0017758299 /DNA_START=246 /DNA_END=596 /DNA_ORIENTATION=+